MSFSAWFKNWIRAFCKLMTFNYRKPKSDAQRRRERERRLKAKHSSANLYRTKKRYKKRRSSMAVQNEKLISGLFGFIGASLGILLLPFGLLDWGRKSAKARKASRGSGTAKKTSPQSTTKTTVSQPKKSPTTTPQEPVNYSFDPIFECSGTEDIASVIETPVVTEPDESTPKSTP